jgi:hypothetical protein
VPTFSHSTITQTGKPARGRAENTQARLSNDAPDADGCFAFHANRNGSSTAHCASVTSLGYATRSVTNNPTPRYPRGYDQGFNITSSSDDKPLKTLKPPSDLAIGILRHAGRSNIAKALRHNARSHHRPLLLLGIT